VLISAVGFTMWPHLFMKSYAAKSDRALRLTVVMYPTFQVFLVPILLIGFSGILAFPGVEPVDSILPFLLMQIDISPWIIGLVCAGALAASMSSGDSMLHSSASIAVRDGLSKIFPGRLDDAQERLAIRCFVVLLALVSYYFAVVSKISLVALLLAAYGGVAQIFPLVFAAFYWPRANGQGAMAGLVTGIAVNVLFLQRPDLSPIPGLHEGVFGLLANVFMLVAVSLLTPPTPSRRVRPYLEA
jgi:SSS family solute:Na+ symporter